MIQHGVNCPKLLVNINYAVKRDEVWASTVYDLGKDGASTKQVAIHVDRLPALEEELRTAEGKLDDLGIEKKTLCMASWFGLSC